VCVCVCHTLHADTGTKLLKDLKSIRVKSSSENILEATSYFYRHEYAGEKVYIWSSVVEKHYSWRMLWATRTYSQFGRRGRSYGNIY